MKASIVIAPLLAVCVVGAAVGTKHSRQISGLEVHPSDAARNNDELIKGPCRKVTFIMARASTEPGNMGISMGAAIILR